jgi:alternative ribosome-rescue factor
MSKRTEKRPNKAKSLVARPLFRCRREIPKKGKGSYRREASPSHGGEASVLLAAC